jgi:hypothetical protein
VTAAEVHDLAAAVSRVQARTTRSRQTALGASELGTCRRRTAYRLAGTVETNPSGGMAAALGTWIHKGALDVLRREYGALIETRLASALIRGHADALYLGDEVVVEDLKTKGRYVYAQTVDTGPRIGELFQVSIYGWLLREGHIADRRRGYPTGPVPVDTIRLRYLDRDTGASHPWEAPYNPAVTAEALGWLAGVLEALETGGPDNVPRDGDGPGVSVICDWCPFLDACWGPPPLGPEPRTRQSLTVRDDVEIETALLGYARGRAPGCSPSWSPPRAGSTRPRGGRRTPTGPRSPAAPAAGRCSPTRKPRSTSCSTGFAGTRCAACPAVRTPRPRPPGCCRPRSGGRRWRTRRRCWHASGC